MVVRGRLPGRNKRNFPEKETDDKEIKGFEQSGLIRHFQGRACHEEHRVQHRSCCRVGLDSVLRQKKLEYIER
jgi:hypothetical protein